MSKKTKAQLEEELTSTQSENDFLSKRVGELVTKVNELSAENYQLGVQLVKAQTEYLDEPKPARKRYDRFWNFSIELWPPAWGLSSYRFDWKRSGSDSREGSYQLGPFG